ncbi:hypothetical protein [Pontibaca salina]|uniref:Uncharacterized protein n=1 Tax=Pontibaca salina TaxID=2795731 RepID=A0A934M4E0_9RHOB|nr:hypothetical protein [Pontibaca salina]MBI6630809.1 hypothetical protein [Pontibaca salina]
MTRAITICSIVTMFALADNSAVAQSLKLVDKPLEEQLDENSTTIAGTVLVGVQRGGRHVEKFTLAARLPDKFRKSEVCLELVSANGRYSVRESYRYEDAGGTDATTVAPVGLEFSTAHADYLRRQGAHGVAALLTSGDCDGARGTPTVAIWDGADDGEIELLFNSFDADQVFAYVNGASEAIACDPVRAESLSAYDTVCVLDNAGLSGTVEIELYRYVNRKTVEPDVFHLDLFGE